MTYILLTILTLCGALLYTLYKYTQLENKLKDLRALYNASEQECHRLLLESITAGKYIERLEMAIADGKDKPNVTN